MFDMLSEFPCQEYKLPGIDQWHAHEVNLVEVIDFKLFWNTFLDESLKSRISTSLKRMWVFLSDSGGSSRRKVRADDGVALRKRPAHIPWFNLSSTGL